MPSPGGEGTRCAHWTDEVEMLFSAGSSKVAPVGAAIGRPPVSSSDVLRTSDARPYGSSIASLP